MKRAILVGVLLLIFGVELRADSRSNELLALLENQIEELGNYRVDFAVEAENSRFEGYYRVAGDCYYIRLGDAEVYCDGKVRYEVDPTRREVVIDVVDPASRHILGNPTRAFRLLDGEFDHRTLSEQEGVATVELDPKSGEAGISGVRLLLNATTGTPHCLVYDADGAALTVVIERLSTDSEQLPRYDVRHYDGFEMIDFR